MAKALDFDDADIHKKINKLSRPISKRMNMALALIGDPPVILADEPTVDMDSVSKESMWRLLIKLRNQGKAILLTSSSMDEAVALCNRIAVMVNGRFKCLGSAQHLKDRYTEGRDLIIKLTKNATKEEMREVAQFVWNHFIRVSLKEQEGNILHYYIDDSSVPLSTMFGIMEKAKELYPIEDYGLGQGNLNQVLFFLTFPNILWFFISALPCVNQTSTFPVIFKTHQTIVVKNVFKILRIKLTY